MWFTYEEIQQFPRSRAIYGVKAGGRAVRA
jgi:hypothetical protein